MIARLRGKISSIKPNEVIVDTNGVGYRVSIPFSTYSVISQSEEADLHIHTHVKEDQFRLFGFISDEEKRLFETLIKISGIGPSIALAILSGIKPAVLYDAVSSGNTDPLVKIPGIGKSKAEKLIFELKRVLKRHGNPGRELTNSIENDAFEAMISLGFDEKTATQTVRDAMKSLPNESLESIIRKALSIISG